MFLLLEDSGIVLDAYGMDYPFRGLVLPSH
jgi:hypothetical protein